MNTSDMFWDASPEELKNGCIEEENHYECLLCGEKIEKGIVYPVEGVLFEAVRYMRIHIEKAHGSVFEYLIKLDKRFTGLTDHQNKLLKLFYEGKNDEEVKSEMEIGSSATIRNHRFVLKEKERQAKVFLTMMELLKDRDLKDRDIKDRDIKDRDTKSPGSVTPHDAAEMAAGRYNITREENEKILEKYFKFGLDGPITTFDMKEKSRLAILRQIIRRFDSGRTYTEKETNEILKTVYEDFVTLRRYLIEYGFMDRKPDGSQYWVKENHKETRNEDMDRKKELREQFKEMKTEAGVYQIRNIKNQKVLVVSTPNLKTMNGKPSMLRGGGHMNKQLQEEWNQYGEEAFVFEVLEVLEEKEDGFFDRKEELKKLEAKWVDKLQPFGERGYHKPGN